MAYTSSILYIIVLLAAALIPPLYLLQRVKAMDRIEPEPPALLKKLYLYGIVGAFPVIFLEYLGDSIADMFQSDPLIYMFIAYFCVPGFIEEGMKYFVVKKTTWKNPAFNYTYDAIVYSVFASLGFASIENIMYVFNYGLGTAIVRAFLSIPAHCCFGVYMGQQYAKAKEAEMKGEDAKRKTYLRRAYLYAAVLHGTYDFLAMSQNLQIAFYVFFIIFVYFGFMEVKKASASDHPIDTYIHQSEDTFVL